MIKALQIASPLCRNGVRPYSAITFQSRQSSASQRDVHRMFNVFMVAQWSAAQISERPHVLLCNRGGHLSK